MQITAKMLHEKHVVVLRKPENTILIAISGLIKQIWKQKSITCFLKRAPLESLGILYPIGLVTFLKTFP